MSDPVDEGDCIEGVASPMQPNRYDYASADEYDQAVTAAYTCTRCGQIEERDAVDDLDDSGWGSDSGWMGGGGDSRGSARGAGELNGSGSGEGTDDRPLPGRGRGVLANVGPYVHGNAPASPGRSIRPVSVYLPYPPQPPTHQPEIEQHLAPSRS